MDSPLVTINILTYNRKHELSQTLRNLREQSYKNYEVIVVDNASTEGTGEMVTKDFPEVIYIKLGKNVGVSAWNEGFKIAKGELVLVLDDDSYPEENSIKQGIDYLNKNPECGILAYNIFNTLTQKTQCESYPKKSWLFIGCGALIRREVIEKIGGFDENYFIYLHELDYSIRAYDAGYNVDHVKEYWVIHDQSMNSRNNNSGDPETNEYKYYYSYISYITFLILRFDKKYALIYGIKFSLNRLIICFRYFYFMSLIKGFFVNLFSIPRLLRLRKPVSREVQKFYNNGSTVLIDRAFFPNFKKEWFLIRKKVPS